MNLSVFFDKNLFDAGTDLFNYLNIRLNSSTTISLDLKDVLKKHFKAKEIFSDVTETYFLGLVDDSVFDMLQTPLSFQEADKKINNDYNGLMVFAVRLNDNKKPLTRSDIADLTRAFNRASQFMPVVLLVKYGNLLAFSTSERMKYQQTWRPGEKIGKVSMLKDINLLKTHAGHSRILEDLIKKPEVKNFNGLYEQWKEVFNIQILNKRFYQELSNWYFRATAHVSFPDDIEKDKNIRNATSLIRLITRVIFIWFIKEKQLVPDTLFDPSQLSRILKEFAKNKESHSYYQAVLQNLFFGTLNQKMNERRFAEDTEKYVKPDHGVKSLFRYKELFSISEDEILALFASIPFLNGGLFDCLDKDNSDTGKHQFVDGFSRNPKKRAIVPDFLFFHAEEECDLNAIYGTKNKKYKVKGLFDILSAYKFTITENTPIEEEIALDPELLGKVFENLLASYNPETQTTARKQTGSFYTPREIVNYMTDESIKAYFKQKVEQTFLSVHNRQIGQGQSDSHSQTEMSDLPSSKIKITRRHLPHWQMTGAFYFITFRTAFKSVLSENEQKIVHEHIVGGNIKFYHLICSVIMPDHVHLILKPNESYDLSRIMKGIKGVSSNKINKSRNRTGTIWQDESFDRIIRDENELNEKIQYMFNNPMKKGLTNNTLNYLGWFINKKVEQTFLSVSVSSVSVSSVSSVHSDQTTHGQTEMSDLPLDIESKICDLLSYSDNPNPFNEVETQILINAIDNCKILDPACGSGAFPMGVLHKLVYSLHKLDPQNKLWKERQIEKVDRLIKDAGNINDSAIRDKIVADLENNKNDIEEAFENNELDYGRKLYLIENCIYGVDIQPIAIQISKLRFFISLIVDQKVNHQKDNFGIRALPNLETKFVAANTLIGLDKPSQLELKNHKINTLEDELKKLRHQYFSAKTRKEKLDCQKKDKGLREKISALLVKDGWDNESAKQLSEFDPYDQNAGSSWFDAVWMFGIKDGFDIVIGNPPYGVKFTQKEKKLLRQLFPESQFKIDSYSLFVLKSISLLNSKGYCTYIISNTLLDNYFEENVREKLLKNTSIKEINDLDDKVFETAVVHTMIFSFSKEKVISNEVKSNYSNNLREGFKIIPQNYFLKQGKFTFSIREFDNKDLISTLKQNTIPLNQVIDLRQAIKTGDDEKYILKQATKKNHKPILRGKDVFKWKIITPTLFVDYGRHLACPRDHKIFEQPKILIREAGSTITASFDDKNFYIMSSLYNGILINKQYKLLYVLCLINSRLFQFLMNKTTFEKTKGAFTKAKIYHYETLPLKIADEYLQIQLSILAKYILLLKELEYSHAPFFECLIDAIIYELYFPHEIKAAGCEVLKHMGNLPELKDDLSDEQKMKVIEKVYQELSDPKHPVAIAMERQKTVKEVRIIEGLDK